eukprot:TRINITY_DN6356_c0_g1_i2.p1 TRINITY_DN6356_c0_g1~~TRINITY_DN6356_c0_g1_i2.p1  ORF type:complete len:284 (+),score=55.88 TRINITY_DN6356_c0_g1_i2:379-1230(+)
MHVNHGMVHRDLKPANILLGKKLDARVADLGLARRLRQPAGQDMSSKSTQQSTPELLRSTQSNFVMTTPPRQSSKKCVYETWAEEPLTQGVGTRLYSSPEQMVSSGIENYDFKADIWSLGLITLQLFFPMTTEMEKNKILNCCRDGRLPPTFVKEFPKVSSLILLMVQRSAAHRPGITAVRECLRNVFEECALKVYVHKEGKSSIKERYLCFMNGNFLLFKSHEDVKATCALNVQNSTFEVIDNKACLSKILVSSVHLKNMYITVQSKSDFDLLLRALPITVR